MHMIDLYSEDPLKSANTQKAVTQENLQKIASVFLQYLTSLVLLQVDKFLNPPKLDDLNDKIGEAKDATQEAFAKVNMSKIFKDLVTIKIFSNLNLF